LSCLTNSSSVIPLISILFSSSVILSSTFFSQLEWHSIVFYISASFLFHIIGHFLFNIVYFHL
jgi:hypothetical protein